MSKLLTLIAPLALALAAAGTLGAAPAEAGAKPVTCDIRVTSSGGMVDLEPVLISTKPLAGSYEFNVDASSAGGTSTTSQGDDFSAGAGETSLGTVSIAGKYTASLTVSWAGGSTSCKKHG